MDKKSKTFVKFWLPVILWMGIIFGFSCLPGDSLPDFATPLVHKIAHLAEYAVLGILFIRALANTNFHLSFFKLSALATVLIFLYALSDEFHQSFVPGRLAEFSTVLSDTVYATIGIYLYYRLTRCCFRNHNLVK